MNLSNLRELNQMYNFQDTIILCKMFEQRSDMLQKSLNITVESVIAQVAFLVVSIEIKASAVLLFLKMLSISNINRRIFLCKYETCF